jgi:hypothetical protein
MAKAEMAGHVPPRSRQVTRTILSRMLLVAGAVAVVACGPRLKPVEYEEPKSSGSGSYDEEESSKSNAKNKSSTVETDTSDSPSSSSAGRSGGGAKGGCEGKSSACGSPCTECAPGDMDCMEVLVMKQCNAQHKCVPAPVDCSAANKADKDKKKAKKDE